MELNNASSPAGGGTEREPSSDLTEVAAEDPFAGVVGMLIGDRQRLVNRTKVVEELNVITQTKGLSDERKNELADRIMKGREPKQPDSQKS